VIKRAHIRRVTSIPATFQNQDEGACARSLLKSDCGDLWRVRGPGCAIVCTSGFWRGGVTYSFLGRLAGRIAA
jgi:hypothetical protein